MRTIVTFASLVMSIPALWAGPQSDLERSRQLVEQWVAVEKTLSEETSSWRADKAILEDHQKSLSLEIQSLQAMIVKVDAEQVELQLQEVQCDKRQTKVEHQKSLINVELKKLESRLQALLAASAPPLKQMCELEELQLSQHIADEDSFEQRVKTIAEGLRKIHAFDQTMSITSITLKTDDQRDLEVQCLNMGSSVVYYCSSDESMAGYGQRSPLGWVWTQQPEAASKIKAAMAMIQQQQGKATLLQLPLPRLQP